MTQATNFKPQPLPKVKQFRKFDFVGNSSVKDSLDLIDQLPSNFPNKLLSQMNIGDFLKIDRICTEQKIARQLARLQFKSGKTVRLVSKTDHESVLVELGNRLVGISSNIARQIVVTLEDRTKL